MSIELLIAYCSFGSVLIPLVLVVIQWKRMPHELVPIGLTIAVSLFTDALSLFLAKRAINTHFVGNLYLAAQFSLLTISFGRQLQDRRLIFITLILFSIFYLVNISIFQGPWVFNSATNLLASLILILLCIYFFYRLISDLPTMHIQTLPMFWIAFAVLFYYSGNFFLFLANNYLTEQAASSHRLMWILHNLLNITKNILFAIGLWQSYRKARSSILSSSAP